MKETYKSYLKEISAFIPRERIYTDEMRRLAWGHRCQLLPSCAADCGALEDGGGGVASAFGSPPPSFAGDVPCRRHESQRTVVERQHPHRGRQKLGKL